jgi:hypothetical protein
MEQPPKKAEHWKITGEMPEVFLEVRTKILEKFENKTDGLNIERVKKFMKENSLPILEYVLYDTEDLSRLDEMLEGLDELEPTTIAEYKSTFNLIFLKRNRKYEELNESIYDEGNLIHELGHGSTQHMHYAQKAKTDQLKVTRTGFALRNVKLKKEKTPWGEFLEEAFAEMLSGEYTERNRSETTQKKIKEKMESLIREDDDWQYDMAEKYVSIYDINERGNLTVGYSIPAVAATGLEMLCEKIPTLRQTLIEARSDVEKLREIPKLINAIKPGLYMEIQKCDYSHEEFLRVQNIIKEAIQNLEEK